MKRIATAYVVLVAAHSYVIALALLFLTEWGAKLGGFGTVSPLFFARQAGAFHLVVASAYLIEYFRYGDTLILLATKAIAVVFLLTLTLVSSVPWVVPVSGIGDAAMGLIAWELRRRWLAEERAEGARA